MHKARKRFGQNFLVDHFVIDSIISAIDPKKGENLVEIGPGLGALTNPVLNLIDKLTVVEIDRDLVLKLQTNPKLEVINIDALQFDFNKIIKTQNQKIRLFGNLPYNISTPLLIHLLQFQEIIADMHFMLQKEVADRLCASPNCKAYGKLSILMQYFFEIVPIIEVPPQAFRPVPKVNSSVIRLTPLKQANQVKNWAKLVEVTSLAFLHRRKTLKNNLSKIVEVADLQNLNIDPNARAENLSLDDYINLANFLT